MQHRHIAITALRALAGLTIVAGLAGVALGLAGAGSIPLLGFTVPAWVLGASVAYMGLRYWRRIPALERSIQAGAGFSWSNFKRNSSA